MIEYTDYELTLIEKSKNVIRKCMYSETDYVVSFSGGKDSTVLLHLVRSLFPETKAVFNNTGLEYPEIVYFVREFKNVDWIRPKTSFFKVVDKFGLPIISKEQSRFLEDIKNPNVCEKMKKIRLGSGRFSVSKKWRYLLSEDIRISNKCCYHLKKAPLERYAKHHNIKYFTGERTAESQTRKLKYHTCIQKNKALPLRLWTDELIEKYIINNNVKICDIYKTERRTGCVACMYGYQFEPVDNNRFTRLKKSHPKYWKMLEKKINISHFLSIIDKSRKKEVV